MGPLAPPPRRPVGWREKRECLGAAVNRESPRATSGFDKGTLAMAHIGLTGAGEKLARFANERTCHRPL
jgi:hypothetical protein